MFTIQEIIEKECINIHFQPILSPEIDLVAGVEALSRGYDPETKEMIPPTVLFQEASNHNLIIELEMILISEALKEFKELHEENSTMLLFINVSEEFFDYGMRNDYIFKMTEIHKINIKNIVLDIHPWNHLAWEETKLFCDYHKEKGCYICIDDIGVDYMNLDLIIYILPDIIKANMIKGKDLVNREYLKNCLRFVKDICNSLGIQTVAKGIESDEDVRFALNNNAKFLQGYYISKPQPLDNKTFNKSLEGFRNIVNNYREDINDSLEHSRKILNDAVSIISKFKMVIKDYDEKYIINHENNIFEGFSMIENIWFLTHEGIQHLDTIINEKSYPIKGSPIFRIYNEGSDFSGKDLYYQLQNTVVTTWVTDPYRSILSNNICVTASTYIQLGGKELILCMNINYHSIK